MAINIGGALCFSVPVFVFAFFPLTSTVDKETMNWCAVMGSLPSYITSSAAVMSMFLLLLRRSVKWERARYYFVLRCKHLIITNKQIEEILFPNTDLPSWKSISSYVFVF
ncbi:hypothetical protein BDV23DRAFT_23375 [Aspergillus alliaceus]|uniref:Uncharacterized protein n=1 Tax=Petromyces alliaceus TaxID=209559 RepID=A0A5N7CJL3_PETAA|nr:hypothetical protein BDV23DRAFT_23375 [Aspergillus alliaceus]